MRAGQLIVDSDHTKAFLKGATPSTQIVIPRAEIRFIHEGNTKTKKERLFADVRSGKVRVLLGSTEKMGAGTNAQTRLVERFGILADRAGP